MVAGSELLAALLDMCGTDRRDSDQEIWSRYYFGTADDANRASDGPVPERLQLLRDMLSNAGPEPRPC